MHLIIHVYIEGLERDESSDGWNPRSLARDFLPQGLLYSSFFLCGSSRLALRGQLVNYFYYARAPLLGIYIYTTHLAATWYIHGSIEDIQSKYLRKKCLETDANGRVYTLYCIGYKLFNYKRVCSTASVINSDGRHKKTAGHSSSNNETPLQYTYSSRAPRISAIISG